MKTYTIIATLASTILSLSGAAQAEDNPSPLPHKLNITPEIKKAFHGQDAIEIREITGTSSKFQVGETYRVTGVCHQSTLKNAQLYLGNTAEAGGDAIRAVAGSSLFIPLSGPSTEFDITLALLRPGILHLTIYDMDNHNKTDNAHAGIYLGKVVDRH